MSEILRETIEEKLKLGMVPPGFHMRNVTEVSIKSFKVHFISIMTGLPVSFPMHLWDKLLPQAKLMLNIIRPLHAMPKISSHKYSFRLFDFNRTPLTPIGSKVQCHKKADKRGTWEGHSVGDWFMCLPQDHYRVFRCYIKATKARRI